MKVGCVGSRKDYPLDHVVRMMEDMHRKYPDAIVVSGGADWVDTCCEQTWLALGGQVVSLRPIRVSDEEYAIKRWELGGPEPRTFTLDGTHPTMGSYASACVYRDMLIAEESDRGLAFWANKSRGTGMTIAFFEAEGKPCHTFEFAAPADSE